MPCWFYDKIALLNTPSIQDGIDHETECQYRKEGTHLIVQIGSQMELGYNTLATGTVYFHRFYMFHSFKTFSPYVTACCCLFLAGKAEETPKKSKDIIKIAKKFLNEEKFLTLGENPREEVMTMEKILLQTLKFDLKVRHPYYFLLPYAKCLKGNKRKMQRMVQMAWTFINDSLCTTLSIQWEPEIIAIAVMYLAGKILRFKVLGWKHRKPSHKHWWEIFVGDLSKEDVEDICHQVLDLYSPQSRYYIPESPEPTKFEPKNGIVSQMNPLSVNLDVNAAAVDSRLENGAIKEIAILDNHLKDPRLESGSVFVKNHFNALNTPVLVSSSMDLPGNMKLTFSPTKMKLTLSPAMPTAPHPVEQSLQDNSLVPTQSNVSRDPREVARFLSFQAKVDASALDPSEASGNPMLQKGLDNVGVWQPMDDQGFASGNNSNDNNDNRLIRSRGFGYANNNCRSDYNENGPMRNRGFRDHGRNNRDGYGQHRFRRRGFNGNGDNNDQTENRPFRNRGFGNNNYRNNSDHNENRPFKNRGFGNDNRDNSDDHNVFKPFGNRGFGNNDNSNDRNENRPFRNRGFGNSSNNNETKPFENRGFGNANCNEDRSSNDNQLLKNRGFGNVNNDSSNNHETKLFMKRGFGNSSSYDNNCNGNDSRPRRGYQRGHRFQRSDNHPRRFNNNYENDRYSQNDKDRDFSKGFTMNDAPAKIVDKQCFNQPPKENTGEKVEEEESWD